MGPLGVKAKVTPFDDSLTVSNRRRHICHDTTPGKELVSDGALLGVRAVRHPHEGGVIVSLDTRSIDSAGLQQMVSNGEHVHSKLTGTDFGRRPVDIEEQRVIRAVRTGRPTLDGVVRPGVVCRAVVRYTEQVAFTGSDSDVVLEPRKAVQHFSRDDTGLDAFLQHHVEKTGDTISDGVGFFFGKTGLSQDAVHLELRLSVGVTCGHEVFGEVGSFVDEVFELFDVALQLHQTLLVPAVHIRALAHDVFSFIHPAPEQQIVGLRDVPAHSVVAHNTSKVFQAARPTYTTGNRFERLCEARDTVAHEQIQCAYFLRRLVKDAPESVLVRRAVGLVSKESGPLGEATANVHELRVDTILEVQPPRGSTKTGVRRHANGFIEFFVTPGHGFISQLFHARFAGSRLVGNAGFFSRVLGTTRKLIERRIDVFTFTLLSCRMECFIASRVPCAIHTGSLLRAETRGVIKSGPQELGIVRTFSHVCYPQHFRARLVTFLTASAVVRELSVLLTLKPRSFAMDFQLDWMSAKSRVSMDGKSVFSRR